MQVGLASHQFTVWQLLADHPSNHGVHLAQRVKLTDTVTARELIHVSLQVLGADLVIDALVCPLEHAPERLDPVSMGHAVNVLTNAVADARVVERHAPVSGCIVREDLGAFGGVVGDELL